MANDNFIIVATAAIMLYLYSKSDALSKAVKDSSAGVVTGASNFLYDLGKGVYDSGSQSGRDTVTYIEKALDSRQSVTPPFTTTGIPPLDLATEISRVFSPGNKLSFGVTGIPPLDIYNAAKNQVQQMYNERRSVGISTPSPAGTGTFVRSYVNGPPALNNKKTVEDKLKDEMHQRYEKYGK